MPPSTTYDKLVTTTRNLSSGVATATRHELWASFPFGDKVVARYRTYGTAHQCAKTYAYYTDMLGNGYGRLAMMTDYDGRWTRYEYDSDGRLIREVSPFGDAASDAPDSQCVVVVLDYTRLDPSDSADSPDEPRWRTRMLPASTN